MESGHVHHAQALLGAETPVDTQRRGISLFHGPSVGHLVVQAPFHQDGARGHQGQEQVGVHGQAVFPSGEEPQAGDVPAREHPGGGLDALAAAPFAGIAPRDDAAHAGAAGEHGREALVEGAGDQGHLAVPGVSEDGDLVHVDFRYRGQVVQHDACRPGPAGQGGEIVFRIDFLQVGGVIHEVVAGVSRRDVAAAQQLVAPAAERRGQEDRVFASGHAGRHGQADADAGLVVRTVVHPDIPAVIAVSPGLVQDFHLADRRLGREGPQHVLLEQVLDLGAAPFPVCGAGSDRSPVQEPQWVGQTVVAGKPVEIRRQLACAALPLGELLGFRHRREHPVQVGFPLLF